MARDVQRVLTMASKTQFIVMEAAACMPASCKGRYRRVAVCEVEEGASPKMISERACGLVRVVRTWEKLNVGSSDRCAYAIAYHEAEELAAELNAR